METITFTCETITPMFLAGADGQTPELRPPSIKGAMRFWWRAMNGHLSLKDLKKAEGEIFGDTTKRSKLIVRIQKHRETETNLETQAVQALPHKQSFSKNAIVPKEYFKIILMSSSQNELAKMETLFHLTSVLEGIGSRTRRAFGSFCITKKSIIKDKKEVEVDFSYASSLADIHSLLEKVNTKKFYLGKDKKGRDYIYSRFGRSERYPYLKEIYLGRPNSNLTKTVGQASHETKKDAGYAYTNSMGSGTPRFASPVIVSAHQQGKVIVPVITVLNAVPPSNGRATISIQDDFKDKII